MTDITCRECNKKFNSEKSLHFHLKSHDLDVSSYYHKHVPRYDLWDGQLIKFKTKDQYLNNEFNTRSNLISWLTKKATPEEARIYSIELLKQRKDEKGLIYAPDYVYLKSIMIPSVDYYQRYQGGYNEICESIGLESRFNYSAMVDIKTVTNFNLIIHYDSREQKPLNFTAKTIKNTLNFGDYGCDGEFFSNVWIDRK
ncbi:MAG: hypothetical protein AABY22_16000, partial [Nanoarchaeota archaeon]